MTDKYIKNKTYLASDPVPEKGWWKTCPTRRRRDGAGEKGRVIARLAAISAGLEPGESFPLLNLILLHC